MGHFRLRNDAGVFSVFLEQSTKYPAHRKLHGSSGRCRRDSFQLVCGGEGHSLYWRRRESSHARRLRVPSMKTAITDASET